MSSGDVNVQLFTACGQNFWSLQTTPCLKGRVRAHDATLPSRNVIRLSGEEETYHLIHA